MPALNSVASHNVESWCRVSAIAELADIFDPAMQVCSWQRSIDTDLKAYLSKATEHGNVQIREVVKSGSRPKLTDLPADEGSELLRSDVAMLAEILGELVDCPSVGLRLARVESAMCPRWHIDRVPIRMLCTYAGSGTEWLDDQGVDKRRLSDADIVDASCQRAASAEVVLLKGGLWQGNEGLGAIHRSPVIAPEEQPRLLLTLDPLWPD